MKDFNLTGVNSTQLYESLSRLTLNRSGNRGTISVGIGEDGSYKLSCVNHKILGRNNYKITRENANELRQTVMTAVINELKASVDKILESASDEARGAIDQKFNELLYAFGKAINRNANSADKFAFTRKDIEGVLLNVNALKENLCVDTLLKMKPEDLVSLADRGNGGKLRKAESFKRQDVALANFKTQLSMCTSAKHIFAPCKGLVSNLYEVVKKKIYDKDMSKYPEPILLFLDKALSTLQHGGLAVSAREISVFIDRILEEKANGEAIGLSEELAEELAECKKAIEGEYKDVGNFGSLNKNEKKAPLAEMLKKPLKAYYDTLKSGFDLPKAYSTILERYGITELYIDKNGEVALKEPQEEDNGQIDRLKKDFEKIVDLLNGSDEPHKDIGINEGDHLSADTLNSFSKHFKKAVSQGPAD